jgi:hypothetical protein
LTFLLLLFLISITSSHQLPLLAEPHSIHQQQAACCASLPCAQQPACPFQFVPIINPALKMEYYTPIKSESDDRHYRGIILPNKLQVRSPPRQPNACGGECLARPPPHLCARNMPCVMVIQRARSVL